MDAGQEQEAQKTGDYENEVVHDDFSDPPRLPMREEPEATTDS
jgi:hypothetical protein